jgi:cobalt/nickel transport system ATP-binding protein
MGTRAKQRAAEGQIALDFTYGVIDKCLLRALSGESSLILTAGGMVRRVEVRVSAFAEEWGTRIPVDEVRSP